MQRPHFDFTVNVPSLVALVGLLVTLTGAAIKINERLASLEAKVDPLWQLYQDMAKEGAGRRP